MTPKAASSRANGKVKVESQRGKTSEGTFAETKR
jgi:hypothetical protein